MKPLYNLGDLRNLLEEKMKRKLLYVLIFLWTILCLYLSIQPMEETAQLSMRISSWIARLIYIPVEECDFYLRKVAHFGVFIILSLLFNNVFYGTKSILICIGIAVIIEMIKIPVDDRHTDLIELCLDLLGVIVGFVVVRLWKHIVKLHGNRYEGIVGISTMK